MNFHLQLKTLSKVVKLVDRFKVYGVVAQWERARCGYCACISHPVMWVRRSQYILAHYCYDNTEV